MTVWPEYRKLRRCTLGTYFPVMGGGRRRGIYAAGLSALDHGLDELGDAPQVVIIALQSDVPLPLAAHKVRGVGPQDERGRRSIAGGGRLFGGYKDRLVDGVGRRGQNGCGEAARGALHGRRGLEGLRTQVRCQIANVRDEVGISSLQRRPPGRDGQRRRSIGVDDGALPGMRDVRRLHGRSPFPLKGRG